MECKHCNGQIRGRGVSYCSIKCQQQWQRYRKLEGGELDNRTLKAFLLERVEYKCRKCTISEWMGKPISLDMNHIDGNSDNRSLENVELLCPNCHSQTSSYKSKNRGHGRSARMKRYREGKTY